MNSRWLLTPILLLATLSACSSNPAKITGGSSDGYQKLRANLDRKIPRVVDKNDLTSMTVLVLDDQQVVYAKGFGYADTVKQTKTSADTAYRIGSISKVFTAVAIMQLHEQGKLNIDKPVHEYLPEFSINTPYGLNGITPRSVMSHYSGIPTDYLNGFASYEDEKTILNNLSNDHVAYKPGEVHSYSNVAYGLLGHIIEHVSGLSYQDYLKKNIFDPMGMKNAGLGNSAEEDFALVHNDKDLIIPAEIRDRAAGDIRMSAIDLSLFAQEMLSYGDAGSKHVPTLLSRESLDEMWRPQYAQAPLDGGYNIGLGWILSYPSKALGNMADLVWHDGGTFHYQSSLMMSKQEKLAVIVFSNFAEAGGKPVTGEIAANTLLSAMRSKNGLQPAPFQADSKPVNQFSSEQVVPLLVVICRVSLANSRSLAMRKN